MTDNCISRILLTVYIETKASIFDTEISKKKEDGQLLSNTLAIMRTKEERPSVKDVKHSDEVERENFVMEKTEFLPNV